MEEFDALVSVMEKLLSPEGCAWDREQTFTTLQSYILEEAHEVIEAVDLNDDSKIVEELGDLLFAIVFYAKLGEQQKRFLLKDVIEAVREKIMRRHPHVFGEIQVNTIEEIKDNWNKIKSQEKGKMTRNLLDGIPPTLPLLVRAQKVVERIEKISSYPPLEQGPLSEEELGKRLLALVIEAHQSGLDAEGALRRTLSKEEQRFSVKK